MTSKDREYAALMLEWSRTIAEHRVWPFEAWLEQRKHQTERKAA